MIPAPPLSTALLLVLLTATNGCSCMDSPASVTSSDTMGPEAKVPVSESPNVKLTVAPVNCMDAVGNGVDVDCRQLGDRQASDIIHRSLDPVSGCCQTRPRRR